MEKGLAAAAVSKSGIIRYEIDKVSTLDEDGLNSPEIEVGGVLWMVNGYKTAFTGTAGLALGIHCMVTKTTPWNIDVDAQFTLVNSDSTKNITVKRPRSFGYKTVFKGVFILSWEDLINKEKGFINNDKIVVEIRFSITRMKGISIDPRVDFADPNEQGHDSTLVINGEKIYVSKGILVTLSPFFKSLFHGEFAEKNKKEMELKDIDRKEFIDMMHVIYQSSNTITKDSAEYLIKLGDRFRIACVIERAEEFLIVSGTISNLEMLRIADKYGLYGLQCHSLSQLKTSRDYKDVEESSIYRNLSDATKAALFEHLVKIV